MAGRPQRVGEVTYADIAALTDVTLNAVHQAATPQRSGIRQHLDIDNLESIVLW